jgi:hypothetical protein
LSFLLNILNAEALRIFSKNSSLLLIIIQRFHGMTIDFF